MRLSLSFIFLAVSASAQLVRLPMAAVPLSPNIAAVTSLPSAVSPVGMPVSLASNISLPSLPLSVAVVNPSAVSSLQAAVIPLAKSPDAALPALWDGTAFSAAAEPVSADTPDATPSYLNVVRPSDRPRVAAALALAQGTRAGQGVLRAAEKVLTRRGESMPVETAQLGSDHGGFDYARRKLLIDREVMLGDPRELAATLIHELLHVVQHELDIPAIALEMELEAHVVTLDLMDELGMEPKAGGFSDGVRRELKISPEELTAWMKGQLAWTVSLSAQSFDDMADELEISVEELSDALEDLEAGPKGKRYALSVAKAQSKLDWARRDLEVVRSKKGRAAYAAFAKRVMRLLHRRHAALNAR